MNNDSKSPSLESHMSRIARGGSFFRRLYQICLVAIAISMLNVTSLLLDLGADDATVFELLAVYFWGALGGLLRVFPYVILAFGLRHVKNLFTAVHGALEDLKSTV